MGEQLFEYKGVVLTTPGNRTTEDFKRQHPYYDLHFGDPLQEARNWAERGNPLMVLTKLRSVWAVSDGWGLDVGALSQQLLSDADKNSPLTRSLNSR